MKKKKKVLQVIGNLKIGGAETVAMNYYRYIDRSKYEFHYLVYEDSIGDYEKEVYELGGKVLRLNYSISKIFTFFYNLTKLLRENNYDIVHSHTLFNNGIVLLAAKFSRIPKRISHSHSIQNKVKDTILTLGYEKIMRRLIKYSATDFLACSKEAGIFLYGENTYFKNGKFIPNGIDVSKFKYDTDIRTKIRGKMKIENRKVLGHVGHLSPVKNQEYLIELMTKLDSQKFVLILLGEGKNRFLLEKIVREKGLENQIYLLGNVENVNQYLSVFDLFLFPSLFEGLPLSLVESQSNGLPSVVSETIPTDGIVSDIVVRLPITKESLMDWKEAVETLERPHKPKEYNTFMREKGFDLKTVNELIQNIYDQ